jgi:hypothetical protein
VLAGLSALTGLLTVVEHLTGWNLHIDQLFFADDGSSGSSGAPGRMAVSIAVSFISSMSRCCVRLAVEVRHRADVGRRRRLPRAPHSSASSAWTPRGHRVLHEDVAPHRVLPRALPRLLFRAASSGVMTVVSDDGPMRASCAGAAAGVHPSVLLAWIPWKGEAAGFTAPSSR